MCNDEHKHPLLQAGQTAGWGTVNVRQQRAQQIQRRARLTVLRKRLGTGGPKPVVFSGVVRGGTRGRGRGRRWVRGRGRGGRGWQGRGETVEEEKIEEFTVEPSTSSVGRGRGRGWGRGRGISGRGRGRGIGGRGRVAMEIGPGSSPAPRPGSRLKIIRSLKGRGKTIIAIKRRLSTGSMKQQVAAAALTTPTRGRGRSRGRVRGRGSLSAGSTPVAGPSGATPIRVSVSKEQTVRNLFWPVGVVT